MSKPIIIEENIILAVINKLQGISAGAEYYTTIKTVDFCRANNYDPDELPAINIFDRSYNPTDQQESSNYYIDRNMELELHVLLANEDTLYIHRVIPDIEKAIGQDTTLGGLIYDIDIMSIDRDPVDQQGERIAHAIINLNIKFRKKKWSITA